MDQGREKGGIARANALSSRQRSDIAKKAADARWNTSLPIAEYGSEDRPLKIGNVEIPCYVLGDERRVITFTGVMTALNMSRGGKGYAKGEAGGVNRGDRLTRFLTGETLNSFVSNDLLEGIRTPIDFRIKTGVGGPKRATGYEATILADICEAVLSARQAGKLHPRQYHIAEQCEILIRGFSRVGIVALVDEATGYQYFRKKDDLAKILEAFIAKELQPWVKTFPDEFYEHMFRLRGLEYPKDSVKRPQYFGLLTNDIIYKRLAPGVLEELKKVLPKNERGRRDGNFPQRLSGNVGYPKLKEHLGKVVAYMSVSNDYASFVATLDRFCPRYNETLELPFNGQDDRPGL